MAMVKIAYSGLVMQTSGELAEKFNKWQSRKNAPFTITLTPTGVCTIVNVIHEKSKQEFDLTDYDSI